MAIKLPVRFEVTNHGNEVVYVIDDSNELVFSSHDLLPEDAEEICKSLNGGLNSAHPNQN